MNNLRERLSALMETAAITEVPTVDDATMDVVTIESTDDTETAYLALSLNRANRLLDQRYEEIRAQVVRLDTRGDLERALLAYTQSYLLQLPLSLDRISDIAQDLIQLARRFKCVPSRDWINVASFNTPMDTAQATAPTYPRKRPDL